MKGDSTKTILQSATRFFSGTMLSRVSGMLRDMSMAAAFGTDSHVAALMVAFRFAHLLRRMLGEGALQSAFVPQFEELRQQNSQRAYNFYRDLTASLVIVLLLIILGVGAGIWALTSGMSLASDTKEILELTLFMMPSLLFICLFGLNASLLQCDKSYFVPSVAPVAFNGIWILGVFFTWHLKASEAMPYLAGFIVLGCLGQWLITLPKTYNAVRDHAIRWRNTRPFSKDLLRLVPPLFMGLLGVGAAQINNALDAVFAHMADSEGPALLWYAIRLQQLPLALFGIAISGALLPPLSRALKAGDHKNYQKFLVYALKKGLLVMIPTTLGIFVLGNFGIRLIYGHGQFSEASIIGTTHCLWGYGLGLVPMTLILILAPAFYAQNNYRTPTRAATACVGLNIALNALMVNVFGLGAVSVAIATSISAWVNFGWLAVVYYRQYAQPVGIFTAKTTELTERA